MLEENKIKPQKEILTMDKELELYFNTYFELFRTQGWIQLMNELKENVHAINNIELTKDGDDLFFRKGQLAVLANLLNMEAAINVSYEEQIKMANDTDDFDVH